MKDSKVCEEIINSILEFDFKNLNALLPVISTIRKNGYKVTCQVQPIVVQTNRPCAARKVAPIKGKGSAMSKILGCSISCEEKAKLKEWMKHYTWSDLGLGKTTIIKCIEDGRTLTAVDVGKKHPKLLTGDSEIDSMASYLKGLFLN